MKLDRVMKDYYDKELQKVKVQSFQAEGRATGSPGGGLRRVLLNTVFYLLLLIAALTPFFMESGYSVCISSEELATGFTPIFDEAAAKLEYMREYFKTKGDY